MEKMFYLHYSNQTLADQRYNSGLIPGHQRKKSKLPEYAQQSLPHQTLTLKKDSFLKG
jgi:hypothetical protein